MKVFDQKFGPEFFASLPTTPGVYKIFNVQNELIYVGKAKNLRRRLGQYRNAKRRKKHAKMRKIVGEAAKISYELCLSDYEALIKEMKVIQEERPKFNRAGAFSFLYPMVGLSLKRRELSLLYTTEPQKLDQEFFSTFSVHGAYRSRHLTGNAFFGLIELLAFVGHQNPAKKIGKYSYLYSFRQIDDLWLAHLENFFRGDSSDLLEHLILALIERPSARSKPGKIQNLFDDLSRFLRHEAKVLARMRKSVGTGYPVSQRERDVLALDYQQRRKNLRQEKSPADTNR